ncbi:transglutaminase-like domain-containing protein [Gemmobacter nectariphilus]|uniref:transglutaminase-like domain-containing protein n=1 Tax=Gemmobacter nectariphilus TaxID=220343 RepID=UPI0004015669|nr:transglutaminase family protein [Gemmobacter nectariphilus]
MDPALAPTRFIDSDHPDIRAFADAHAGTGSPRDKAVALAAAVRDAVPYDLYAFRLEPETLIASNVLAAPSAFCVPKAVLLAAVARAAGIPARVGFADVRNHLTSPRFSAMMDDPDFRWHAYTALNIDGQWLKATPAFDRAMCEKQGVAVLTFDGRTDSIFQPFDATGRKAMDYIAFHGEFDDLPFDLFTSEMRRIYPRLLVGVAEVRAARAARQHRRLGD